MRFLVLIDAWPLAHWACTTARLWYNRLYPALPAHRHPGGRPKDYSDESVLLMLLVKQAWRFSLENIAVWVAQEAPLALALGFTPQRTISASQLWRRGRQLGLLPYLFFFLALVWTLVHLGAISGKQLVLDSTNLKAWYKKDPDANLATARPGHSLFGFKLHAVVDRFTELPLFVVVTPGSFSEVLLAPMLILTVIALYGLQVAVVYADAAYFTFPLIWLLRTLGIIPVIDYNLRRHGRRFLATLFFIDQWRRLRAPRTAVERCFAYLKRYYGLKYFQVKGLAAVYQYALLVHASMLAVAVIAYRLNRPDLMTSRTQVLAYVTNN